MKELKVLIIDDDRTIIEYMVRELRRAFPKVEIDETRFKKEAIQFLQNKDYDLITLDGELSDEDHGRQVLAIMSREQIAKTVVYSGDMRFIVECKKNGVMAFCKMSAFYEILPEIISAKNLS